MFNKLAQKLIVLFLLQSICICEFFIEDHSDERLIIKFTIEPNSLSLEALEEYVISKINVDSSEIIENGYSILLQKKDKKFVFHSSTTHSTHTTDLNIYDLDSVDLSNDNLNKLSEEEIYTASEPMVMRDVILFSLIVNPIQWNQDTNMIEIVTYLEIIFEYSSEDELYNLTQPRSKTFEDIFSSFVFNYNLQGSREINYQTPSILYICGGNIESNLSFQNLIEWKTKQGYKVYTASTSETGSSSSSIKNYIYNAYNNFDPRPEYVALVGDANGSYSVPTFYECWNHDVWGDPCEGDQPYTELVGNDLLPEIIIGRISIRSTNDMSVISNKIINYEKATSLNEIQYFYNKAALVADPSHSGQSTIFTNQYIEHLLYQNGIENISTNFGNGGYDNWMENELEDGVLYLNYRGYNGASGFDNYDIDGANNGFMLPFATFLTCNTGGFAEDNSSLVEYFLRAGSVSNPKGAIASVGTATGNTHTLFNNIVTMGIYSGLFSKDLQTAGQALVNGKLELLNTYPTNPYNWISAFCQWNNLMGDPSTHLWTDTPQLMSLNVPEQIPFGTKHIDITVNTVNGSPLQNARVTLVKETSEIFETHLTDENGFVRIIFDYTNDGPMSLTAIKQNYKPEEREIDIISDYISINCENPDNLIFSYDDSEPNPGDSIFFSVPLKNFGTDPAFGVSAQLESSNSNVSVIYPNSFYETILPDEEIYGTELGIVLSPVMQDKESCELLLTISDNSSAQWNAVIDIDVIGTVISVENIYYPDNIIEPGIINEIDIELLNFGRIATSDTMFGTIQSNNSLVQVLDNQSFWSSIDPNNSSISTNSFSVLPSSDILGGTEIKMNLFLSGSDGFQSLLSTMITVGEKTVVEPTGPDTYGYYIYDSEDNYDLAPDYNWIEISDIGDELDIDDPGNGRGYCSEEDDIICNSDEDCDPQGWNDYGFCEFTEGTKIVDLPFTFKFYGEDYSSISVSSNGWIAFGETEMSSFRNYAIPGPGGPSPMLAVFWDDHRTNSGGRIYTYFDQDIDAFIVQWDDLDTYFNGSDNTFQAILYNSSAPPNDDSEIKLQYKEFRNTSIGSFSGYTPIHGGYCTIGIEDKTGERGLQYTFNNNYPVTGHVLDDNMALYITTMSPQSIPLPILYYDPSSITANLLSGESIDQMVIIGNSGDNNSFLDYAILKEYPDPGTPFDITGDGPDNFGYYWTDSRLDTNFQFNWINISNENQVEFEHNDQSSGPYDIGFDFPFYGVQYNQCIINPNGWIGFGADYDGWSNQNIPLIDAPRPAVFAFWDDLNPVNNSNETGSGNVFYQQMDNSFIIWFNDVIHYPGNHNGVYNFQVILYQTGEITVNYQMMDGDTDSGTIGTQGYSGTRGLSVAHNQNFVENELSVRIKYNFYDWLEVALEPEQLEGTLSAGENFEFNTQINTEALANGEHNMSLIILSNIYSAEIPVNLSINENENNISKDVMINSGWNIVGLPLAVENNSYEIVFPPANNNTLFMYDGMYLLDSTLALGDGYWLRFDSSETVTVTGIPIFELSLYLSAGWNLVSGPSENFNIYTAIDTGNIIVSNTLYGYDETYYISDVLIPGKGYWLRASGDGQIILNSEMETSRISNIPCRLNGKANTLTVNGVELYFGIELSDNDKLSYSLPPKPPVGAFDVRFKDDTRVTMEEAEIEVMSPSETLTIAYNVVIDAGEHMNWVLTSESGKDYILEDSGEITIPSDETFVLNRVPVIPVTFTLHQNYPNPFNPITILRYDLPSDGLVTLSIYDMLGRQITQLVNTTQQAGFKSVQWDATDSMGKPVSAGVYLYQIQAGEFAQTKKMVLLK